MKEIKELIVKRFKFIKRHITKKEIILGCTGIGLILIGLISWDVFFSRYYIFKGEEKQFLEAVKEFYYYHPEYLPKPGSMKTKTLASVYEENRLEELKIPKRKDICDVESWVRVYNDNGKYIYHTYLKCGNIQSRTDHKGPEIVLNGDSTIYISVGEEYKELGVKSVKDNKDGKMDVSSVTIDSSKVNTKVLGDYVVTYKAKDKLNNITTVERTVRVVRTLTNLTREMADETDGYIKGIVSNNFVLFSGNIYEILKVNEDGTILIMGVRGINNIRYNEEEYENSKIDNFLNNDFLNTLSNKDYVVEKEYCVGNITGKDNIEEGCNKKITRKVSLLSYYDLRKTMKDGNGPACNNTDIVLANKINGNMLINSYTGSDCTTAIENIIPVVSPMMTLKADLVVSGGNGKYNNPYKLEDYEYGKIGSKLNKRIVGEYINYSGMLFRISKINDDETVTLISIDALSRNVVNGGKSVITFNLTDIEDYSYNPTEENNVGYLLNTNFNAYMNESGIIETEYEIPINDPEMQISKYTKTKFSARISLPTTYDMYSVSQGSGTMYPILLLDKSTDSSKVLLANPNTGRVLEDEKEKYNYSIRPVITLNKNVTIKEGKGTASDPYYVR